MKAENFRREMTDAVKRGVEELDRIAPGWEKVIDLDDLDLGNCAHCVVGQLRKIPQYVYAMLDLQAEHEQEFPEDLGFDAPDEAEGDDGSPLSLEDAYRILTTCWRNAITERLRSA